MLIQHEFRAKIFPYIEKNTKGIYIPNTLETVILLTTLLVNIFTSVFVYFKSVLNTKTNILFVMTAAGLF